MSENKEEKRKGLLIAFEGCDRAGKSTQISLLNKYLNENNTPNIQIAFPCYDTPIGKLLKDKLKHGGDPVIMNLLFVANRYELQDRMFNYLNDGIHILCDRYKDSGRVYGVASELDDDWINECDSVNMEPDYVIYIDIDPKTAAKREGYGEQIYDQIELQKTIRTYYKAIIEDHWIVVDGNEGSIQEIHEQIIKKLKEKIN